MSDYTEQDLEQQLKPLSSNGFLAFFQKIWRWWLSTWYNFEEKHPKLAHLIYMVFFFIVFSEGVTIFQILVLIFLPELFGLELAATEWMWPKLPISLFGVDYNWNILGYDMVYNEAGEVMIGGGLGYFIAFEIATFLAQCINFPLQRNITYRSHGNPWYQAMWYFIGWVLVSLFCNAINGLWIPPASKIMAPWLYSILVMIAQGGISMVIFFFIFMIIFPDNNKVAARKKAKYEKLVAAGAPAEKIEAAKAAYDKAQYAADLSNAEKEAHTAASQLNSKVMKYFAHTKKSEKLAVSPKDTEEAKTERDQKAQDLFDAAAQAIDTKLEKAAAFEAVKARAEQN